MRAPELDVPVATYTESTGMASLNCALSGHVTPFSVAEQQSLYPTTADYLARFVADALTVAKAGFLTPDDAARAIAGAYGRRVP